MTRAYVSSTSSDLRRYRQAALDQLYRQGFEPVTMEYTGTGGTSLVEASLRAVDECELYILIVGFRYGFVPVGFDKSINQLEYERALQRGVPVYAFVLSDDVPVLASSIEVDENLRGKLISFKNNIYTRQLYERFRSPEELSARLASILAQFLLGSNPEMSLSSIAKDLSKCRSDVAMYKSILADQAAKFKSIVPADPIWRGRKFEIDKEMCFGLLPFRDDFFTVYESAVMPAAEEIGLKATHAGEIFGNREVVEDIWESICAARIVVADVTGRNPNVFYELGICHTLGKDCIIITQNKEDVPFDIRHRRFIEYAPSKLPTLRTSLRKTIQSILSLVSTAKMPS